MRRLTILATLLLSLTLLACSSVEVRHEGSEDFVAGDFHYYKWRSKPLQNPAGSSDPLYLMDPVIRQEVDAGLAAKGYVLDVERAEFSVDYLTASGMRMGVKSQDAGGIEPIPSARPNRQINQAMVDNANALSGSQETSNIALLFNRVSTQEEVWHVIITKIVEDSNSVDKKKLQSTLSQAFKKALAPLPKAS